MAEGQIPVTLDINKLLQAYDNKDFMEKVFRGYLKENPGILVEALRNHILQDLVKDGTLTKLAIQVQESLSAIVTLDSLKGSHIFTSAVNESIRECVRGQSSVINSKVSQAVQTEGIAESIKAVVTSALERRLDQVLADLRED